MDASETFRRSLSTADYSGDRSNATLPEAVRRVSVKSVKPVLKQLYGPIANDLAAVEIRLRQELQHPSETLAGLLRHGLGLGGKRLRPAIHLLVADALGGVSEANVVIGTVLEMVHTATLIHDDVLDNATTRRHVPTINAQWDAHTSILLGDYLFAQSFRLAATLESTRACRWVGEASRRVCEGELRQVLSRDDLLLDEHEYFEIIRGKTAELCRVACSLAAAEAGCDEAAIDGLAGYGDHLGMAFQIADDYLDLWGDDQTVGKTLGTDVAQGKLTLPVIRLLDTATPRVRSEVVDILQSDDGDRLHRLRPFLEDSDARQYTVATAKRFRDQSLRAIERLPESDAKACLSRIVDFSIRRSF